MYCEAITPMRRNSSLRKRVVSIRGHMRPIFSVVSKWRSWLEIDMWSSSTQLKIFDMPAVYALAEFVVLASQFDQWGLCINEAFCSPRAAPAASPERAGLRVRMVVDGVNGFIVEPGKVEVLADRIEVLSTDLSLRGRLADNAWSPASYWTPGLFASNLMDLPASIVAGTKNALSTEGQADSRT